MPTSPRTAAVRLCLVALLAASLSLGSAALGQGVPPGPAPMVQAIEDKSAPPPAPQENTEQEDAKGPEHPPFDLIPPIPMPDIQEGGTATGPQAVVAHDPQTGETYVVPFTESASGIPSVTQGYGGADGGGGFPELMEAFSDMTVVSDVTIHPWRMNCKLVMRFVGQDSQVYFFAGSGSMIDAETVLTAGHCVYSRAPNGIPIWDWATDIWVYPGWDGVGGSFNPPPSTIRYFGYGHCTTGGLLSTTAWVDDGSFDGDLGVLRVTRAVGGLTGWYGTYANDSETCATTTGRLYYNASWPGENCGGGLHTGTNLYFWFGYFDSCPGQQLQIDTTGGCYNAGWGGMSGSGAYYLSEGTRYVHAISSNSNRTTIAKYCKMWQGWVDYLNNSFIPTSRGTVFDLQALDCNAEPATITSGGQTTLLNHLAYNPTNNNPPSANYTFRVYLSSNDAITSSDTLLSTQSYSWDFGAMSSVRVNMGMVTIPANTPSGNYWLGVIYDAATDGNASNNATSGWDAAPITVACPSQAAPTGVSATDGTSTSYVQITWTGAAGATDYRVYRGSTALGSWQTATTYNDTDASPGTLYHYSVRARNICGSEGTSASDTGYRALSPPTGVSATDGTETGHVQIQWNSSTGASHYRVYRHIAPDLGGAIALGFWQPGTTYNDTLATPGVTYYYWVKAAMSSVGSQASEFSSYNSGWRALEPPPSVSGFGTMDYYRVIWGTHAYATHYGVWRNTVDNSGTASLVSGWITTGSYDDTGVTPGVTYYYWVKAAMSSAGYRASAFSNSTSGYRTLSPPTGLTATEGTYTSHVAVTWNSSSGASHYQVYRNTAIDSGSATPIGTWQTGTAYNDTTATPGVTHYYWVKAAVDSSGGRASGFGPGTWGWRALSPPATISASDGTSTAHIAVSWSSSEGASHYQLYRNTSNNPGTAAELGGWQTATLYQDAAVTPGVTYYYWVKAAIDSSGGRPSDFSVANPGWRALPAPKGLAASDGTYPAFVRVTWTGGAGASQYRVYRHTSNDSAGAVALGIWQPATSYDDTSAAPGVTYYYWARAAVDSSGGRASDFSLPDTGYRPGVPEPTIVGAVSRKGHAAAGEFPVDVSTETAVEYRSSGPTEILVTFDQDIQGVGGLDISDVALSSGLVTSLSARDNELLVRMRLAANAAMLGIAFPGICQQGDESNLVTDTLCFGVLLGDANGDGKVNIFDLVAIRNHLNQPVTAGNFRHDPNIDGAINIFDLVLVRNNLNISISGGCP